LQLNESRTCFDVPTQRPPQAFVQISEKIVGSIDTPAKGNKVHFFSGATLQGKKAPAGFGVRVTAGGTKSFVLFHMVAGRKYLETLGRWDENEQGGTLTVRDAIIRADKLAKDLKNGRRDDPRPERTRRLEDGDNPEGLKIGGGGPTIGMPGRKIESRSTRGCSICSLTGIAGRKRRSAAPISTRARSGDS
jgi:hypothetical protein